MPQIHPFPPVWNECSRILILGSFPSVRSREEGFYYAHPQNRFWKVLAHIFEEPVPQSTEARRDFALRHHIALWDVIESCEISGSSDASIRNATVNDFSSLLHASSIQQICCNGQQAFKLYTRYCEKQIGKKALLLPSTSPANAAWSLERLTEAWRPVLIDKNSPAC